MLGWYWRRRPCPRVRSCCQLTEGTVPEKCCQLPASDERPAAGSEAEARVLVSVLATAQPGRPSTSCSRGKRGRGPPAPRPLCSRQPPRPGHSHFTHGPRAAGTASAVAEGARPAPQGHLSGGLHAPPFAVHSAVTPRFLGTVTGQGPAPSCGAQGSPVSVQLDTPPCFCG